MTRFLRPRLVLVPIGVGPRVDDIMATAIPGFSMSPCEDLELRRP